MIHTVAAWTETPTIFANPRVGADEAGVESDPALMNKPGGRQHAGDGDHEAAVDA